LSKDENNTFFADAEIKDLKRAFENLTNNLYKTKQDEKHLDEKTFLGIFEEMKEKCEIYDYGDKRFKKYNL